MRFVYFIQAASSGAVKIGVAKNPVGRMADHQVSNHEELSLLAIVRGDCELEARLHTALRASHRRNEWFHLTADVLAVVAICQAFGAEGLNQFLDSRDEDLARARHGWRPLLTEAQSRFTEAIQDSARALLREDNPDSDGRWAGASRRALLSYAHGARQMPTVTILMLICHRPAEMAGVLAVMMDVSEAGLPGRPSLFDDARRTFPSIAVLEPFSSRRKT